VGVEVRIVDGDWIYQIIEGFYYKKLLYLYMEIWKDIKGYEGHYQVSNLGRVKSLDRVIITKNGNRKINGRILKLQNSNGYRKVQFTHKGRYFLVHRLVASTFIDNSYDLKQVNHKNLKRDDNRVDNLEWVSASENVLHGHYTRKYQSKEVVVIKNGIIYKFPSQGAAKRNGVASIERLVKGIQLETNGYKNYKDIL
jgi:hypothetical protein